MNTDLINTLRARHSARFGRPPVVLAYAPGRVEVLGNHTDYNDGFVLSAAIDLGIGLAIGRAEGARVTVQAVTVSQEAAFDLPVSAPAAAPTWSNYLRGVVSKLSAFGRIDTGFNATFAGDIPLGAGLSSSAALEVAAALAVSRLCAIDVPPLELAKLAQAAEHEFAGARCGLLDQMSSLFGREHALVFIDFRTLSAETVPLPPDVAFLLADTGVKHNLAASAYNDRRAQCEQAAAYFAARLDHPVRALRDVSPAEWRAHAAGLDPAAARRAAHVIGENTRVLDAVRRLREGDAASLGALMSQSHESSRTQFENSCPELDFVAAEAARLPGVLGARLSGGGFGGSAVLLLRPEAAPDAGRVLAAAYERAFRRPLALRRVRASAGARVL